jgi:membrane-associated phospholipid phosphatase
MASTAMLLSTLFTQIVKHIVVAPRPLTWFAEHFPDIQLPVVEGVKMNLWYSFPSGHTTSFFALAFVLSIVSTNYLSARRSNSETVCQSNGLSAIAVQVLLFALATLGAYSRIYLSQHFALDIFGGIVSGLTAGIISYAVFYRFEDKKWYNYRVFAKK